MQLHNLPVFWKNGISQKTVLFSLFWFKKALSSEWQIINDNFGKLMEGCSDDLFYSMFALWTGG
jgi:hypothetical protein